MMYCAHCFTLSRAVSGRCARCGSPMAEAPESPAHAEAGGGAAVTSSGYSLSHMGAGAETGAGAGVTVGGNPVVTPSQLLSVQPDTERFEDSEQEEPPEPEPDDPMLLYPPRDFGGDGVRYEGEDPRRRWPEPPPIFPPPVMTERLTTHDQDADAPRTAAEIFLMNSVRWLRRLLTVGITTAVLTGMVLFLMQRNRASQAESFVRAQIGAQQLARQVELQEALKSLQDLYAELKDRAVQDPASVPGAREWRILWRQRLQEVVMRYRLDGQVDFTRNHTTAEAALRDAQLYLHSLEREWVSSVNVASPLNRKLEQCLKEARDDLN